MPAYQEVRVVHGYRRAFLRAGSGPPVLLVHGLGESSATWEEAVPLLAKRHTVLAPDLLGHGDSDKPRADYSLGGFANGLRDLLLLLGVSSATVVGHSLGGGIALQFAYQYPQMCDRLVLVASGGLGAEVTPLLRAASLPGAGVAIAATANPLLRVPLLAAVRLSARLGVLDEHEAREVGRIWASLHDPSARWSFLRTLRGVMDVRGQSVTSRDRLYLAAAIPMLLVWGGRDAVLPVTHARRFARELPGCRLEEMPMAGHLPHRSDPARFVEVVERFLDETSPRAHDPSRWRDLLASGRDGGDTAAQPDAAD